MKGRWQAAGWWKWLVAGLVGLVVVGAFIPAEDGDDKKAAATSTAKPTATATTAKTVPPAATPTTTTATAAKAPAEPSGGARAAKLATEYFFEQIGFFVEKARGECADLGSAGDADGQKLCLGDRMRKIDGDLRRLRETLDRSPLPAAGGCRTAGKETLAAAREVRRVMAGVRGVENLNRIKPARKAFNRAATSLNGRCPA